LLYPTLMMMWSLLLLYPMVVTPASVLKKSPSYDIVEQEDTFLTRLFGKGGSLRFWETRINEFGGAMNQQIDHIHDSDHGVRVCNIDKEEERGVCFTAGKCEMIGGEDVGFCPGWTHKNTCCRFSSTCGDTSDATAAYFSSPDYPEESQHANLINSSADCVFKLKVKHGSCQVKVDFFVFEMAHSSSSKNLLNITTAREREGETTGKTLLMSVVTAGSHIYLHVEEGDMIIVTLAQDEPASPASSVRWNMLLTQVDCRSGLPYMKELRAPAGCLQYHRETNGTIRSLNVTSYSSYNTTSSNATSPINSTSPSSSNTSSFSTNSPSSTTSSSSTISSCSSIRYSICLHQPASSCSTNFTSTHFLLPTTVAGCESGAKDISDGASVCCQNSSHLALPGEEDGMGNKQVRDRFCGTGLGRDGTVITKRRGPLVLEVVMGTTGGKEERGFLVDYTVDTARC